MPNNQPPPPPSQATPSASTTPPRGTNGSQPTLGELIARISENISALVRGEIDLAKAKGQRMAKEMGLGAGLLGAAGVLALFIFGLLLGAMTAALSGPVCTVVPSGMAAPSCAGLPSSFTWLEADSSRAWATLGLSQPGSILSVVPGCRWRGLPMWLSFCTSRQRSGVSSFSRDRPSSVSPGWTW